MSDAAADSWIQWAIGLITTFLVTWGSWVTIRIMGFVHRDEYNSAKEKRDEQLTLLMASVAKHDDIKELRAEIAKVRDLIIADLTARRGGQ
jgi:hypothetical protein